MTISLEQLGNIGELIAAIATLATLFYLALQIRQNNHLLRSTESTEIQDTGYRWRAYLIEHKDIASLYLRGMAAYDSLDYEDRLRFNMLLDQLFFSWASWHHLNPRGDFAATTRFLHTICEQPGGRAYWERGKARFRKEFVEWVETNLPEQDKNGLP